jgi:hypothetical protein
LLFICIWYVVGFGFRTNVMHTVSFSYHGVTNISTCLPTNLEWWGREVENYVGGRGECSGWKENLFYPLNLTSTPSVTWEITFLEATKRVKFHYQHKFRTQNCWFFLPIQFRSLALQSLSLSCSSAIPFCNLVTCPSYYAPIYFISHILLDQWALIFVYC